MQFSQQLVSQWHCKTSCWRIAQCNIGCLAIVLLREALHAVESSSTFRNGLQQLRTPFTVYHPSSYLSRNFMAVLTRAHAPTSCFSFRGALRDKSLQKLHSVTGPQHQTSANLLNFRPLRDKLLRKLRSVAGPQGTDH